jgi:hypothetical protein
VVEGFGVHLSDPSLYTSPGGQFGGFIITLPVTSTGNPSTE